jgi:hypothetical protein
MIVQIDGNDPAETTSPTTDESGAEPDLKVLFPTYQLEAELPKETTTKNFDVPAEAADVKQQPESIGSPRGGPYRAAGWGNAGDSAPARTISNPRSWII